VPRSPRGSARRCPAAWGRRPDLCPELAAAVRTDDNGCRRKQPAHLQFLISGDGLGRHASQRNSPSTAVAVGANRTARATPLEAWCWDRLVTMQVSAILGGTREANLIRSGAAPTHARLGHGLRTVALRRCERRHRFRACSSAQSRSCAPYGHRGARSAAQTAGTTPSGAPASPSP